MGNGATFPEWERARQNARPEDDSQKRLVELLQQPIAAGETKQLAVRKKQLQDLADGMPQPDASRMHQRLADPRDPLGQFMTYELSTPLRNDLVKRLANRDTAGSRGTDVKQRGIPPPPPPPPKKTQDQQSTGPSQQAPGGGVPFLIGPPVMIQWPGITSPQYFPMGFPPAGIFMRPVLLIPQSYPTAPTQKKSRPPPPPPPKKKDPKEKEKEKEEEKSKKPRKKPKLPPIKRGPSIIDWLSDQLTHSSSAAMMIGGLLLTLPAEAVGAAIAAAVGAFAEGEGAARAGELAAKEMFKWTLKQKGLAQNVYDLNEIMKRFPGVDMIEPLRPWQVKMWGVDGTRPKFKVAMDVANAMEKLYGDHPAVRLPTTTAKELLKAHDAIAQHGAWPTSWPDAPTVDQMKVLLRDTGFAVPDDLVTDVRSAFGKKLLENPKLRELIPDVSLGSLVDPSTLSNAEQTAWGERVSRFLFSHVAGVGVTTDQLRALRDAGQIISSP